MRSAGGVVDKELLSEEKNPSEIIFQINDINLVIPPTNISVRKEDMMWQWKTLRTKVSTKVPSGHGVVQVSVRLVFTPDLFLHMHRLICQLRQSPFCYVESAYLRDSICPDWPRYQNMAFTMTNLTIQNFKGSPGTFIVDLDLRWFNYKPYALNWIYRDEWQTIPFYNQDGVSYIRRTIDTFGAGLVRRPTITSFGNSSGREGSTSLDIGGGITDYGAIDSFDAYSKSQDITGGRSITSMLFTHAGEVFDLLPRDPWVMRKATPVLPQYSNIYKRYCNYLQQKNLYECFGIDLADESFFGAGHWERYSTGYFPTLTEGMLDQNGGLEGDNVDYSLHGSAVNDIENNPSQRVGAHFTVDALHGPNTPRSIAAEIADSCYAHTKKMSFFWHEFTALDMRFDITQAMNRRQQEAVRKQMEALKSRSRGLDDIVNGSKTGTSESEHRGGEGSDKNWTFISEFSDWSRQNTKKQNTQAGRFPTTAELGEQYDGYSDHFFYPPIPGQAWGSGFGLRFHPIHQKWKPHNGLDVGGAINTPIYAAEDGVLWVSSNCASGTVEDKPNYKINTTNGESFKNWSEVPFTSRGYGIQVKLEVTSLEVTDPGTGESVPGASWEITYSHLNKLPETVNGNKLVTYSGSHGTAGTSARYHADGMGNAIEVRRGDLIGYMGSTGSSTGSHLHVETNRAGTLIDPTIAFSATRSVAAIQAGIQTVEEIEEEKYLDSTGEYGQSPAGQSMDTAWETAVEDEMQQYATSPIDEPSSEDGSSSDWGGDAGLSEAEKQAFRREYESYINAGWVEYEDNQDVTNLLKRTVAYTFISENSNFWPTVQSDFSMPITQAMYEGRADITNDPRSGIYTIDAPDNLVISNIVGSLSHIVASIPILGQEFPTHQHLGSMEPSYVLEFVTSADSENNDNLSEEGALLEYMRSNLQKNSRTYRPVPDGHCVATDHFITRLLGTYKEEDFVIPEKSNQEFLKKRTVIHRTQQNTVEGHAGMSSFVMELSETNPYNTEILSVISEQPEDRDELRARVLNKLWNLDFSEQGLASMLMAELTKTISDSEEIAKYLAEQNLTAAHFSDISEISQIDNLTIVDQDALRRTEYMTTDWPIEHYTGVGRSQQSDFNYIRTTEGYGYFWEAMEASGNLSNTSEWSNRNQTEMSPTSEIAYANSNIGATNKTTTYIANDTAGLAFNVYLPSGDRDLSTPVSGAVSSNIGMNEEIEMNDDRTGSSDWWAIGTDSIGEALSKSGDFNLLFGEMHDRRDSSGGGNFNMQPALTESDIAYYKDPSNGYRSKIPSQGDNPTADEIEDWYNENNRSVTAGNTANMVDKWVVNSTDYYKLHPEQLASQVAKEGSGETQTSVIKELWMTLNNILRTSRLILAEEELYNGLESADISRELYDLPAPAVRGAMWSGYIAWLMYYFREIAAHGEDYNSFEDMAASMESLTPADIDGFYTTINWGFDPDSKLSSQDLNWIEGNAQGVSEEDKKNFLSPFADVVQAWGAALPGDIIAGNFTGEMFQSTDSAAREAEQRFYNAVENLGTLYTRHVIPFNKGLKIEVIGDIVPSITQSLTHSFVDEILGEGQYYGVRDQVNTFNEWFFSPEYLMNSPTMAPWLSTFKQGAYTAGVAGWIITGILWAGTIVAGLNVADGPLGEVSLGTAALARTRALMLAASTRGMSTAQVTAFVEGSIARQMGTQFLKSQNMGAVVGVGQVGLDTALQLKTAADKAGGRVFTPTAPGTTPGIVGDSDWAFMQHNVVGGTPSPDSLAWQMSMNQAPDPGIDNMTSLPQERKKLAEIKRILTKFADDIISNPSLMMALGFEDTELPEQGLVNEFVGAECYPDLELPRHPYYDSRFSYSVSPDFYMWNAYEDAGLAVRGAIEEEVYNKSKIAVEAAYNFHKRTQKEGLEPKSDAGLTIYSGASDLTPRIARIVSHPEGSDQVDLMKKEVKYEWAVPGAKPGEKGSSQNTPGTARVYGKPVGENNSSAWVDTGPTGNPFHGSLFGRNADGTSRDTELATYRARRQEALQIIYDNASDTHTGGIFRSSVEYGLMGVAERSDKVPDWTSATDEELIAATNSMIPISSTDGNPQYVSQPAVDKQTYGELALKMRSFEVMMGSREGYLGNIINEDTASKLSKELVDTRINTIAEYEQFYTPANLQNIARNSSSDIISNKMSMKRAYPTFKLFFIEEDEHESRFLNMDDFYSYNAVKEFTFYSTRKDPGDTATIILQNINGTLDGTRRNAIVDLDYFDEDEVEKIEKDYPNIETKSDTNSVAAHDQPFTALVLRPGMNVQLRVGYSNDPNMLSVLLNGRATDINWNKNGDLVELTVQSFGTELTQKIKGVGGTDLSVDWDNQTYYTTHQLLGAMMTQPELQHFGRWEYGRLRQIGEDKNADLDFYPYSREGYEGNNPISSSLTSWISQHPVLATALATGTLIAATLTFRSLGARAITAQSTVKSVGSTRYVQEATRPSRVFNWMRMNNPLQVGQGLGSIPGYLIGVPWRMVATMIKNRFFGGATGWGGIIRPGGAGMRLGTRYGSSIDDLVKGADELVAVLKPGWTGQAGAAATAARSLIQRITNIQGTAAGAAAAGRITAAARATAATTGTANIAARNALAREVAALQTRAGISRFAYWPMGGMAQALKGWAGRSSSWPMISMVGKATFGNIMIKAPVNLVRTAVPLWIAATGADALLTSSFRWAHDNTVRKYRQSTARVQATLKMTPADDNLFPPNPASYMTLGWYENQSWLERNIKAPFRSVFDTLLVNSFGITYTDAIEWFDAWSDIPDAHILEKRVRPGACRYKLRSQTIWQTFQEMSLRHPGWIHAVRPYGTKFRNTMFFGVPSQRYWARPADTNFVLRMNKLYRYISDPANNFKTAHRQAKKLYASDVVEEWYESARLAAEASAVDPEFQEMALSTNRAGVEADAENMWTDQFQTRMMLEFIQGMENRFVPFRRWHMITSDQDIVHNGIISSEASAVNAVNVQYIDWNERDGRPREQTGGVSPIKTQFMKASSQIPDNMLNTAVVSHSNCKGQAMALRYGQASLMYGLKEMYKGEIMTLGNPRIRPWDVCILMDDYNDMYGPIEVESVVHMFSHETGYLTEIKPNAVVIANEISSWPILEGIKLFAMAKRSIEENAEGADFFSNADMFFRPDADPRMVEFFMDKYSASFGEENPLEDFMKVLEKNNLTDNAEALMNQGLEQFETTLLVPTGAAPWGVVAGVFGAVALAAGSGRLISSVPRLLGAARHPIKTFNAAHYNPFLQGLAGVLLGTSGVSMMTQRGGAIGAAAAWMIGMPILFAKCMEEETVNIVPLVKGNRPIVSGLTLKSPAELFNSILGNVSNAAEDTMNGMTRLSDEWEVYRNHSWAAYQAIHGERKSKIQEYIHDGVTLFDWSKENL